MMPEKAEDAVLGGSEDDPLTTTVTRYRGPAAQKIFSLARTAETGGDGVWRGSEASRSIFALTNQNAAPPITTDSETLFELRQGDGLVTGRLRLVDYLNPNDPLYFESRKKAVSVSDYDLAMTRVAD